MEIRTIAQVHIPADITGGTDGESLVISNGSPIKTSNFCDSIVGAIRQMEMKLDSSFTVDLWFGSSGVTVTGTTS
jgi:hypothetical protein